ncbi:MAG: nucleoside kinase [Dysgonamonadaceae bacterium]|jgi:uridine kinase|nr:nucleoside kinase [Dysgonamonadaceae bacterium]
MEDTVRVHCLDTNEYKDVPMGSSLLELIDVFGVKRPSKIVHAKVNNKSESLAFQVFRPRTIEYVDLRSSSGMRTYVRSLCFVLAKAVNDLYPEATVYFEHAISKGYYFRIKHHEKITLYMLAQIKERMHDLIAADLPFISHEVETAEAVVRFREQRMEDKALLLETSDAIYSRYFELDGYIDYFYSQLTPSTGYLTVFDIEPYNGGFLLRVPKRSNPEELEPVERQDKLLAAYREHLHFLRIVGLNNVGDLNKAKRENRMSEVIQISEAYQDKKIGEIGAEITRRFNDGVRVALISGPSSSGKTTFRKRLEVQLMVNLLKPVGISLDDYFIDRDQTPLDEFGERDYESLYALDLALFDEHVRKLLKGEEINLPSYNFQTGKRENKNHKLRINSNNIIIVEGIHALNPKLTEHIPAHNKFMIYVSALTSIVLDDHNCIPASDNRLLRRIVRDYRYRNYSAIETISRWDSVRRGEDKWIFPFQENADVMFNSAMIYELAAIRRHAEPILQQVPREAPEYTEANRLLKFLSYFNYITDRELPPTSLLREFLGGSSFRY